MRTVTDAFVCLFSIILVIYTVFAGVQVAVVAHISRP